MVVWLGPVCLSLSTLPSHALCFTRNVLSENCKRNFKQKCIKRPQIYPSVNGNAVGLRVFVLSDLHTDYSENMAWVKRISTVKHKKDALLVAGDVAETFKNFIQTMSLLKDRFEHVFYVPGNHDLWCRWETDHQNDSIEKLNKLLGECKRIGVETNPIAIDGIGIIPLFSWYHESFDREEDISGVRIPSLEMACKDFHACKWPPELSSEGTSLAQYFDQMNNENQNAISKIQRKCSQVISFSHFIPRQELCPEKRMLFYPNLPKIIGSDFLEARVRSIHSVKGNTSACHVFGHTHFCWDAILDGIRYYLSSESSIHCVKGNVSACHVFGHTHFSWDAILDGIRYVQAPLAYPRERKRGMNGGEDWLPFCVYSDGQLSEPLSPCYWSDYYSENPRAPHITQLAPWVAKYYLHRKI